MEVERRWALVTDGTPCERAGRREVPDVLSWLHSFSLYAAVICSKFPHKARELWVYQALMIADHCWCGG